MLFFKKNKQAAIILAVIAIGLILAILILNTEQHQDTHQELNHTEESMLQKQALDPSTANKNMITKKTIYSLKKVRHMTSMQMVVYPKKF